MNSQNQYRPLFCAKDNYFRLVVSKILTWTQNLTSHEQTDRGTDEDEQAKCYIPTQLHWVRWSVDLALNVWSNSSILPKMYSLMKYYCGTCIRYLDLNTRLKPSRTERPTNKEKRCISTPALLGQVIINELL